MSDKSNETNLVNCSDCIYNPMCGLAAKMDTHSNIKCKDFKNKPKLKFEEIDISDLSGRPYYSIIYWDGDEKHCGYSSYSIEIISEFLKEYFM